MSTEQDLSIPLSAIQAMNIDDNRAARLTEEKTFRSKYSRMSVAEVKQYDEWGISKDGYIAGGNFDENPNLAVYTLKKYHILKNQG
jgi:hypothetical protein